MKSTNDIKLRNFQYKCIVTTDQFLTKCNIVGSAQCEFCSMEIETVSHLFWECAHVQQFWTSVSDLLRVCDSNINITVKTITFEPVHKISNNVVCATSKSSDQPAHTRSLIRAFASRLGILLL